jgi:hypothetical protein
MFSLLFGKKKEFNEELKEFTTKVDSLVTDILASTQDDLHQNLMALQSPDKCNDYAIILSDELGKKYKEVQLKQFADTIFISKKEENCKDADCLSKRTIKSKDKAYSKKELCDSIASHYIRILNIIAAVLTAINPQYNMCLRRINALYETTNENINEGTIKICDDNDKSNPLYPNNLLEIPGFQEMLNLYYFHMIQNASDSEEKYKVEKDYELLVRAFENILVNGATFQYNNRNNNNRNNNNRNNNNRNNNNRNNNNRNNNNNDENEEIDEASLERQQSGINSLRNSLTKMGYNKNNNNTGNDNNNTGNANNNTGNKQPNENIAELKGLYEGLKGDYNGLSSRYNNISGRLNNINQKLDGIRQPETQSSQNNIPNSTNNANNQMNSVFNSIADNTGEMQKSEQDNNSSEAEVSGPFEIPSTNNNDSTPNNQSNNVSTPSYQSNNITSPINQNKPNNNNNPLNQNKPNNNNNPLNQNKAEDVSNQIINGVVNSSNNNNKNKGNLNNSTNISYEEYPPRTSTKSAYGQMGGKLKKRSRRKQKAGSLIANNNNNNNNNASKRRTNNKNNNNNGNTNNTSRHRNNNNNNKSAKHSTNNNSRRRNNNNNNAFGNENLNNSELSENSSISMNNNNNNNLSENNNNNNRNNNRNNNENNTTKFIKHRETKGDVDGKIEAFKYFVENYYSNPHLSGQIFDILNKIPLDYSTKSELCYEEKNGEIVPRKINIESKHFAQFKRNYENLQNHYVTLTNKLSQILENMMFVDPQDETKKHLKLLTSQDLSKSEEDTRKLLKDYYSGCQDMYMMSIRELEKAITDVTLLDRQQELEKLHQHENRKTGKVTNKN